MNTILTRVLGIAMVTGAVAVTGCGQNPEPEAPKPAGAMERTGAALDRAKDKTVEVATNVAAKTAAAAKATAAATKDLTGQAVEKTGDAVEKAGTAVEKAGTTVEKAGTDLQK